MHLYRLRAKRSLILFWGDKRIASLETYFHAFPWGLEKATILHISLILPSRREERKIIFPFYKDQQIWSNHKKNA